MHLFIHSYEKSPTNNSTVILKNPLSSLLPSHTYIYDLGVLVTIRATFWVKQHSCPQHSVVTAIKVVWALFWSAYDEVPGSRHWSRDTVFSQHQQWSWEGVPDEKGEETGKSGWFRDLRDSTKGTLFNQASSGKMYPTHGLSNNLIITLLIELTFNVVE